MFANRSRRNNEHFFLGPSIDASYQVVSEEKINMWKAKVMAKAHIAFDKVS
jgi:hypothetical protein